MSGVFLCHSSCDKSFVTKLASDLTLRGIPVWFDSWEMETGDSLYERIFRGIDNSTFLVLCLSPNSIRSKWVRKELNAALAKEDKLNRHVIMPIRLADCEVPLSIADRIYADFSHEYLKGVEILQAALKRNGAGPSVGTFEKSLLPLRLRRGLYLERVELQEYYSRYLAPEMRRGATLDSNQVLEVPDENLEKMRSVLRKTLDNIESDPRYTPDIEQYFRQVYARIRTIDTQIPVGVSDIANGLITMGDAAFFSETCFWFIQIARHDLVSALVNVWRFSRPDSNPPLGEDALSNALASNSSTAKLYGVNEVILCDVFNESKEHIKVWTDRHSGVGRQLMKYRYPELLCSIADPQFYHQYLIPQMVAQHRLRCSGLITWDLPGRWRVGLS